MHVLLNGRWLKAAETRQLEDTHMYIFVEGFGSIVNDDGSEEKIVNGAELGWRPYTENRAVEMTATTDCGLITIEAEAYQQLLLAAPQTQLPDP